MTSRRSAALRHGRRLIFVRSQDLDRSALEPVHQHVGREARVNHLRRPAEQGIEDILDLVRFGQPCPSRSVMANKLPSR
ncbi:hypothetical protein [Streptomyces sp. NPDC086989]|uniref:hypothetical protein n=1 Tax=Streptomyces sp. NPDC086989 TaxID=3365764 RepID=UPI00382BAAE2